MDQNDLATHQNQGQNDNRRGKVFSLRLTEEDRRSLEIKAAIAAPLMPWSYERRSGSLGSFIVWAALQWKNRSAELPGIKNPLERLGAAAVAGGLVVPRRRRRGTTTAKAKRKGKAKPKAKAKGKGKRKAARK